MIRINYAVLLMVCFVAAFTWILTANNAINITRSAIGIGHHSAYEKYGISDVKTWNLPAGYHLYINVAGMYCIGHETEYGIEYLHEFRDGDVLEVPPPMEYSEFKDSVSAKEMCVRDVVKYWKTKPKMIH